MGWTFGWSSKEAVVDHLGCTKGCFPHKILKQSVRGNVLWQLVEINPRPEHDLFEPFITIWCNLLQKMEGEWGYKDMSIACGPLQGGCPKSYLNAVTDPDEHAKEWIEKALNPPKIEAGAFFRFGAEDYEIINPSLGIKGSAYSVSAKSTLTGKTFRFKKSQIMGNIIPTAKE